MRLILEKLCFALVAAALLSTNLAFAAGKTIVVGSTFDASGPTKETMKGVSEGSRIYIEQLNARGGINGRQLKVVELDDAFKPDAALANAQRLVADRETVALFQVQGTGSVAKVGPWAKEQGIAVLAPYTGAANLQEEVGSTLFFTRASYRAESEQIMRHAASLGIKNVGVVFWSNPFGTTNMPLIEAAAQKYGITVVGRAPLSADGKNALEAATTAAQWKDVQAIVNLTGGKSATAFLKAYRPSKLGVYNYFFSVISRELLVGELGPLSRGLIVVQVTPWPWGSETGLQREFRVAMKQAGKDKFDYYTYEGYMNAKVLAEVLKNSGVMPTRESVIKAARAMRLDFGGVHVINFKEGNAGSSFTEITMLSGEGRFIR